MPSGSYSRFVGLLVPPSMPIQIMNLILELYPNFEI